eukprot:4560288-Amphidinium_carterae.1
MAYELFSESKLDPAIHQHYFDAQEGDNMPREDNVEEILPNPVAGDLPMGSAPQPTVAESGPSEPLILQSVAPVDAPGTTAEADLHRHALLQRQQRAHGAAGSQDLAPTGVRDEDGTRPREVAGDRTRSRARSRSHPARGRSPGTPRGRSPATVRRMLHDAQQQALTVTLNSEVLIGSAFAVCALMVKEQKMGKRARELDYYKMSSQLQKLFQASVLKEWTACINFQAVDVIEWKDVPKDAEIIDTRWVHVDKASVARAPG